MARILFSQLPIGQPLASPLWGLRHLRAIALRDVRRSFSEGESL